MQSLRSNESGICYNEIKIITGGSSMKIERVAFFDIDGTLFDSSKYHLPIE